MTWYAGKSTGFHQPPLGQLIAFGTSEGVRKGNLKREHKFRIGQAVHRSPKWWSKPSPYNKVKIVEQIISEDNQGRKKLAYRVRHVDRSTSVYLEEELASLR